MSTRPPVLVLALGVAFLLLMASLVIGSLATPEFPPYVPTTAAPAPIGDSLVGPVVYTVDASRPGHWRRFAFSRNSLVDSGAWDIAFRRTYVVAGPGVGLRDLGRVPFDSVGELPVDGYVGGAVGKWYEYNYVTHLLRPKGHVYAVRTAEGRYGKLEILSYYCAVVGTGCVTFRYAVQGDGSRRVAP